MESPLSPKTSTSLIVPDKPVQLIYSPLYIMEKAKNPFFLDQVYLLVEKMELAWHYHDPRADVDEFYSTSRLLEFMHDFNPVAAAKVKKPLMESESLLIQPLCKTLERNPDAQICGFFTDPGMIRDHFTQQDDRIRYIYQEPQDSFFECPEQPHLAILPQDAWVRQSDEHGTRQTFNNTILILN